MKLEAVFLWILGLELGIFIADKTFTCHLATKKDRKNSAISVATDLLLIKFNKGTLWTGDKTLVRFAIVTYFAQYG